MTRILPCTCKHAWQDARYGKGKRVFNSRGDKEGSYRCTVCLKEK